MANILPILLAVPHGGLWIPPEVAEYCQLTLPQVAANSDAGATEIFNLSEQVDAHCYAEVARVIVDVNRALDDRRDTGVLKTTTCWRVPVYRQPLPMEVQRGLLDDYYHPYHAKLTECGRSGLIMGIDCHTMASVGPPFAPDSGRPRPIVCLSDRKGMTLPRGWIEQLAGCFERAFEAPAGVNAPFAGGYTIRRHCSEMPWVQLEINRGTHLSAFAKRDRVLAALTCFCSKTSNQHKRVGNS